MMNVRWRWSPVAALLSYAVILGAAACTQGGNPDTAPESAELDGARQIAELEIRVEEAHRTGDVSFLDTVYAPSFRFVHSTGETEERAQRLSALTGPEIVMVWRSVDSLGVEVHRDVALSTGRIHVITDDDDPQWREYTVRYARVYALRDGRWRLLTHHSTGISFGPPE